MSLNIIANTELTTVFYQGMPLRQQRAALMDHHNRLVCDLALIFIL